MKHDKANKVIYLKKWKGRRQKKWPHTIKWKAPPIGKILPNLVTIVALCMGLTAIQCAFLGHWQAAVASVLVAGFLDGIDGRLASLLKSSSDFGAELDSLSDFINFGVAPSLIIYFFSLYKWKNVGWSFCLFFSACMALRLARFNIQRVRPIMPSLFSVGVPAPAGALLVLFPMFISFAFYTQVPPVIFAITILPTALMMTSRYPTFAFKRIVIPARHMAPFVLGALIFITGLASSPWETLCVMTVIYVITWPISGYFFYRRYRNV